jgi:hypothetical protein
MFNSDRNKTLSHPVYIVLILVSLTLFIQGCAGLRTVRGTGDMASEEREVSGFTAVDFAGIGTVLIEIGEDEALQIEAEDNLLQYIETEVRGDTLHIELREGVNIIPTQSMFFHLTARELDRLSVSGLGNIDTPGLESNQFSVNISGGGDINLDELEANELSVDISGLGDLHVDDGSVEKQTISISGGGNYNGQDFTSNIAKVVISGLGSATVWATEELEVDISGGGSVRYKGDPTVDENVSGIGRIEKIGE